MLFMTFYAFLIISVHKILNFGHFSQKHYRHTDGPADGQTDTPSYRDARTHLKSLHDCWEQSIRSATLMASISLCVTFFTSNTPKKTCKIVTQKAKKKIMNK